MAEELGLIGVLARLFGFFLLLRWSTRVALKARTRFGQLTAAGLTMTIFFYIAINLMMVMGLAPVVGIPLPLFSYGGMPTTRSEEHTSELQSLMRISYAVFCLKKKKQTKHTKNNSTM